MYYIDTSVLVAYYCPEPMSEIVERFLQRLEYPVISTLTEVEFASAIAGKVRGKELSREDGNRIINQFNGIKSKIMDVTNLPQDGRS